MERAEWLRKIRQITEALYDRVSPEYWVHYGFYENETHIAYLRKFLQRIPPHSTLLSAACGAGRYDGMLLEAGHIVIGTDQSEGMLKQAREHFPEARYEKMSLQEMDFHEAFDGAICMDAMENIFPEDWPVVLKKFQQALKPGGFLYFTLELPETDLEASYERAKAKGLPVVRGELADEVEDAYARIHEIGTQEHIPGELAGTAAYHYYPSPDLVGALLEEAGLSIEEEGAGNEYEHFIVRKK